MLSRKIKCRTCRSYVTPFWHGAGAEIVYLLSQGRCIMQTVSASHKIRV
jgi:hypothetical protein